MRVLVIGFGSIGQRHFRHARELGHEVLAYDIKAPSPTEAEAWAWRPEAVIIATPTHEHTHCLSKARAYARKNRDHTHRILVEKPLGRAVADLEAYRVDRDHPWSDTERVGYSMRYHSGIRVLREVLSPRRALLAWITCRQDKSNWPGSGYDDMLLEGGSHEIDLARWLFGPCRLVAASGENEKWLLKLEHESGCVSTVLLDGTYTGYDRSITVLTDGDVVKHATAGPADNWSWSLKLGDSARRGMETYADAMYLAEMRDFLGNVSDCATMADGRAVVQLCDDARRLATLKTTKFT